MVRESVEQILRQSKRIGNIVQSLVNFSHSGESGLNRESFLLHEIVSEAIALVRLSRAGKSVECRSSCPDDLMLAGDKQQLIQVVINLLTNACDASKPGDTVELLAFRVEDHVQMEVLDQGAGIPEDIQQAVFEPFFTTKRPGEGTGLGLSLVHKIIGDHNGTVEIDSAPGTGTRVVVQLPLTTQQPAVGYS